MQYNQDELKEIAKYALDPVYFINECIKVNDARLGIINITLSSPQEELIKHYHTHDKTIACNHRQSGKTLLSLSYILWRSIFFQTKSMVLGRDMADATRLLSKIAFMYEHLPENLKETLTYCNKNFIEFANGSQIRSTTVNSPDSLRGCTIDVMYFDEPAYQNQKNLENAYNNMVPALSANAKIIMVSSANSSPLLDKLWSDGLFNNYEYSWLTDPTKTLSWSEQRIKISGATNFKKEYENSGLFK